MVIGDDDQSIYEWRGAAPHFIREKVRSTDWDKYFLDLNFRSCAPQVILAKELISIIWLGLKKQCRLLVTFPEN